MNIILVRFVDMNCLLMIISMRVGRKEKRSLKKNGEVLLMLFVAANLCIFDLLLFLGSIS